MEAAVDAAVTMMGVPGVVMALAVAMMVNVAVVGQNAGMRVSVDVSIAAVVVAITTATVMLAGRQQVAVGLPTAAAITITAVTQ